MTGKGIGFQNILYHHHETVDGFPHIGRTACARYTLVLEANEIMRHVIAREVLRDAEAR